MSSLKYILSSPNMYIKPSLQALRTYHTCSGRQPTTQSLHDRAHVFRWLTPQSPAPSPTTPPSHGLTCDNLNKTLRHSQKLATGIHTKKRMCFWREALFVHLTHVCQWLVCRERTCVCSSSSGLARSCKKLADSQPWSELRPGDGASVPRQEHPCESSEPGRREEASTQSWEFLAPDPPQTGCGAWDKSLEPPEDRFPSCKPRHSGIHL